MSEYTATVKLSRKQWQRLLFVLNYAANAMAKEKNIWLESTEALQMLHVLRGQAKIADLEDGEDVDG